MKKLYRTKVTLVDYVVADSEDEAIDIILSEINDIDYHGDAEHTAEADEVDPNRHELTNGWDEFCSPFGNDYGEDNCMSIGDYLEALKNEN